MWLCRAKLVTLRINRRHLQSYMRTGGSVFGHKKGTSMPTLSDSTLLILKALSLRARAGTWLRFQNAVRLKSGD